MAQKILLKKSAVADKVPAASGLSYGEITINYASGNDANNFIAARRADDATTGSASILIYDKKYNDKTYAPIIHSHTVDSTTSTTSTNPVQNAVITKYVTGFSSNVVTALNGKAASSHDHTSLKANTDNRNVETKPNDYNSVFKIAGLKYSTAVASPSNSTYGAVAGIRAWSEKSGGEAHELFFDGANGNIYHRVGEDTSWEGWKQLAHTDDIPTIPTVNDSKVIIKQNGTEKGSFTLNQAGATTIELTDNNTTYTTGTTSTAGLTKLFTTTGAAIDGAINQSAMTTLLKNYATSASSYMTVNGGSLKEQIAAFNTLNPSGDGLMPIYFDSDSAQTATGVLMVKDAKSGEGTFYGLLVRNDKKVAIIKLTVSGSGNNGFEYSTLPRFDDVVCEVSGGTNVKTSLDTSNRLVTVSAEGTSVTATTIANTDLALTQELKTLSGKVGSITIPTVPITGVAGDNTFITATTSNKNVTVSVITGTVEASGKTLAMAGDVKGYVNTKLSSVYKYQGSCTYAELTAKTGMANGDVWNVTDANGNIPAGTNYAYVSTTKTWDALGGTIDLSGYSKTGHTHNYAGSSSAGGAATSANKLNSNAGSATQPIYFKNGVPSACTYTLGASVPSGAKFTDTTYTTGTTGTAGLTKLFTATGTATDGAINQSAMTKLLNGKSDTGHTHVATAITLGADITYTSQLDTAQTVTIANRGDALDDALSGITKALIDDEEVIAGAITDLNTKINDFAITAEETGTGNVVTGISADGKKVIAKKGSINPSFTVSNDSADTVYLIGSKLGDSINTSTTQYASTAIPWSFDYKVWMKGSNLYAASDARLKVFDEENEVFDWDKFEQIPVKYYRWKDKPFGKAQIGTCAQTINEIYPEVVCQHADGTYGVAYDRLALISVEGVKKLRQELEEKERENTELKATVSSLTEDLVDLTYTSRTFTLTTTGEGDATISMERKTTGSGITFRIDYSYDNVEWVNNWDFSPITLKNGETLYLRGRCPRGTYSPFDYLTFVFSGTSANTRIIADGYLYKLIGSGKEKLTTLNKYDGANTAAFANLFSGCTMLSEANLNLCATGLSSNAYKDLFNGCTALTNTPEINILEQWGECAKGMFYGCSNIVDASNITVSSSTYGSMSFSGAFYGCSSLKTGPSLYCDSGLVAYRACINMFGNCNSLTGVGGNFNNVQLQSEACRNMFYGCTALTTPMPISIALVDSKSCSHMFSSCESLVEAPMSSLPGNTNCDNAYAYMFMTCKSLKKVPELSALTVGSGCYVGMFAECTALENGPTIRLQYYSAETVADMFRTCNSLKSVKLDSPVRISSDMATCSWFRSNTGSGILYYVNKGLSSNEVRYLESSLPSGWTVKDWSVQDETN